MSYVNASMRMSPPQSVTATDDERTLVALVVEFANQGAPETPGAVERHFRKHQFARRAQYWKSIDPVALGQPDPGGKVSAQMARDFGGVQLDLRRRLQRIVEVRGISRSERTHLERS